MVKEKSYIEKARLKENAKSDVNKQEMASIKKKSGSALGVLRHVECNKTYTDEESLESAIDAQIV